jgi:hypothetical protein
MAAKRIRRYMAWNHVFDASVLDTERESDNYRSLYITILLFGTLVSLYLALKPKFKLFLIVILADYF